MCIHSALNVFIIVPVHCYMHVFIIIAEKVELGISSFGVSITTMEEVFIKVGLGEDATLESK